MATEVAAQHPVETWQVLSGAVVGIIGLAGIIFNRQNKDIDDIDKRQTEYQTQTDARINSLTREFEGASNQVGTMTKQIEEIFKKLTTGAESFSVIRVDVRELETRIEGLTKELEQQSSAHHDELRELKAEYRKLKDQIELVERGCLKRHPGATP